MTQITTDLYQSIGQNYSDAYDQLQLVDDSITLALYDIVDVTSAGYVPGNAAAVEIELALLGPFNAASVAMTNLTASTSSLTDAVRAINSHVINNTTGSATATAKLATWINANMITLWPSGAPLGWWYLSSDAGYDVATWNTTS